MKIPNLKSKMLSLDSRCWIKLKKGAGFKEQGGGIKKPGRQQAIDG